MRIPRKNVKPFKGKPMIQWSIEAAKASRLFSQIIVSTDDEQIYQLGQALRCQVHMRPADDGATGTQEIAAQVLETRSEFESACVIYPCSPMLTGSDLVEGYDAWRLRGGSACFAMSVLAIPGTPDAGCWYWGSASAFRARLPLRFGSAVPHEVDPRRFIDINTLDDWSRAESMFNALRRDT